MKKFYIILILFSYNINSFSADSYDVVEEIKLQYKMLIYKQMLTYYSVNPLSCFVFFYHSSSKEILEIKLAVMKSKQVVIDSKKDVMKAKRDMMQKKREAFYK